MAQNFYMPITSSNINPFSKFFHWWNLQKMCSNINTKDPTTPYKCRYTTLWNVRHRTQAGDDSDQLRDQCCWSLTCGFQTAWTWILSIMLFGGLFYRWFINVDNSRQFWSTEWGKLLQRLVNRAIGQWRRWLECIVQQQSGHIEHLMWKLRCYSYVGQ